MMMSNLTENRIVLPDRFRDPYIFEGILSMQDGLMGENVTVDMSRVNFIEPYSMVSFLLLGRNYLRKRGGKIKLVNIPVPIHQYLSRMDFFEKEIFQIDEPLDEKMFLRRNRESRRLIELIEIPNKERKGVQVISSAIKLFRQRASLILKYWMSDAVVDYFVTVISELCQNIFEHSLDTGFLAIQTYRTGSENIARLVISDSGIGILKSFESRSDLEYSTPAELIEMTLTKPISSKRDFGYGLCQVNTIVERLKGSLFIRSGNASLAALYNKKDKGLKYMFHRDDLDHFDGTQISISLSA